MMSHEITRTSRLEARIAPDVLAIVKQAAELQGRSVSDFVVSAAQEAAHRTIEEVGIIRLSAKTKDVLSIFCLTPLPQHQPFYALKKPTPS